VTRVPPNKPLQRMNAYAIRSQVDLCRDAAGCRPRLLAAMLRLRATGGVHR
jgi:hypothetical protein